MSRYRHVTEEEYDGPPEDLLMWKTRSTLLRLKRPVKVIDTFFERKHDRGKRMNPDKPPKSPFDCADAECQTCFPQFFPAVFEVTDDEARKSINGLVKDIKSDLAYLRDAVQKNADCIVNRWKKKSREKRKAFLLANTDLFELRWAPIHLIQSQDQELAQSAFTASLPSNVQLLSRYVAEMMIKTLVTHAYRVSWFLPYLDAETLAEDPLRLLGLINGRIADDPGSWMDFDNNQLALAEQYAVIMPEYNPNSVVMQGSDFGKLVKWDAERAHSWQTVGYNKAQYILTAQQTMLAFLRKIATGLLEEVSVKPVMLSQPKWERLVQNNFTTFGDGLTMSWSEHVNQPYSHPPKFDPNKFVDMVDARWRAAVDEIWLAQTDPAYVQFLVRNLVSSQFFEYTLEKGKWRTCVDEIMFNQLRREWYWRQMHKESHELLQCYKRLLDNPGSVKLRQEYDMALWIQQDVCIEFFAVQKARLDYGLPFQKGFQRNFEYSQNFGRPSVISRDHFDDDPLFWSLSCIGADNYRSFTMDPELNFRVLDDCIRSNPKEASRLGQGLYDLVSDMAATNQLLTAVRCEKLRNREPSEQMIDATYDKPLRRDFLAKIRAPDIPELGRHVIGHFINLCSKNQWPGGRHDEKWLIKATAARESLAAYWKSFRFHLARQLRQGGVSEEGIKEDITLFSGDLSEEYLAEVRDERQSILAQPAPQHPTADKPAQIVWGKENQPLAQVSAKKKAKTRKNEELTAVTESEMDVMRDTTTPVPQPLIRVKRENLVVLRHLFPSGKSESPTRTFAWQHFVNAMLDAGFSVEQGSGSAVSFKHQAKDNANSDKQWKGSIVFHRPHPDSSIDPIMMKSMGKRLAKWFGWHSEIFTDEKEKSVN